MLGNPPCIIGGSGGLRWQYMGRVKLNGNVLATLWKLSKYFEEYTYNRFSVSLFLYWRPVSLLKSNFKGLLRSITTHARHYQCKLALWNLNESCFKRWSLKDSFPKGFLSTWRSKMCYLWFTMVRKWDVYEWFKTINIWRAATYPVLAFALVRLSWYPCRFRAFSALDKRTSFSLCRKLSYHRSV